MTARAPNRFGYFDLNGKYVLDFLTRRAWGCGEVGVFGCGFISCYSVCYEGADVAA